MAVAGHLPGPLGEAVLTAARTAFTGGLHTVAVVAAAVLATAAAVALAVLRKPAVPDEAAPKLDRKADSVAA